MPGWPSWWARRTCQFESEAFNRAYRVAADDQRTGHAILPPRLMERLLPDALGNAWRIDGTWILSWEPGTTDLDRLAPRLGLLSAVVRSVPRHVWQDHGDPTRPRSAEDAAPAPTLRSEPPDLREALL